ncbi:MAG: TIGR02147 family protein [Proteobacteria bacterium]|nr:MAG: TIGR02147 family protein [Pseudomonadota bacterium]
MTDIQVDKCRSRSSKPLLSAITPCVLRFINPRDYLDALYRVAKSETYNYSYLQYSEDLGFSRTNVIHLIMRGKRPLTSKSGEKIADAVDMKGLDRRYWLNLVAYHYSNDDVKRDRLMMEMNEIRILQQNAAPQIQNLLEFYSEWYHSAILAVASLESFTEDAKILGWRLEPPIRPDQAERSLILLQDLGLLIRRSGSLQPLYAGFGSEVESSSLTVTRHLETMIGLGKRSLIAVDEELRDVCATTFACPAALIGELKSEIRQFRKKIMDLAENSSHKDSVYHLNLQLFPLTNDLPLEDDLGQ